ncbi:MAG: prolipoprotein diacylglyceryl transferase [Bacteroidota bacterium]|nr:prolipoprotein diacylglyceryl transferase [Bacteroidota bacterium]
MFPTLADLINYLLHTHVTLPIQTLGLFMALSFIFSFQVFVSEFKRKEKDGKIHAFAKKTIIGNPASVLELFVNGSLGFLFGFKIIGAALAYKLFLYDPKTFIVSTHGNLVTGVICGIAFGGWAWYDRQKERLPKPVVVEKIVHPYQLMPYLTLCLGFWGFIGAKLFDMAEHRDRFKYDPWGVLFSANGFSYYGGLVFGALAYLYICYKRGMKLSRLADIGSPGMMLAYAIGRIGCQLSGDGDWGIVNSNPKPNWLQWLPDWMWSFKYPHNEINAGAPIKGCVGNFCNELINGVYPTPFYEVVLCMLLFIFMWAIRRYIYAAGLMFYIYLIISGVERIFIETIRINIKYRFLGINFSQAEWISFAMLIGGFVGIGFVIYRKIKMNQRIFT